MPCPSRERTRPKARTFKAFGGETAEFVLEGIGREAKYCTGAMKRQPTSRIVSMYFGCEMESPRVVLTLFSVVDRLAQAVVSGSAAHRCRHSSSRDTISFG